MINKIAVLFLLIMCNTLFSQKKEYPPIIQDKVPYKIMYSDFAKYTYNLDTKNISVIKPNTAYLKILTFESEKKAVMELFYNIEEVQLIDNKISKTAIKKKTEEISYSVIITDNKITLINPKTKQKLHFIAIGIYDDLVLKNINTNEIYDNQNPLIEKNKHY